MKKVMIPTCKRPFNVFVNGVKYTYPSGTEQEVPDEVAIVIEHHEAYHEEKDKIDRVGDGSQGGGTGGGYSTCKVHVTFNTENTGFGVVYSTLINGNPASATLAYRGEFDEVLGEWMPPSQKEYDIEVICGSHIIVCDFNLNGVSVESDFTKHYTGSGYGLFVPGGATGSSITISF